MNSSYVLPFSRRSILRVAAILVIGYALTAAAIQLWAQEASPAAADGWISVNPSRPYAYGIAASDGQETTAVRREVRVIGIRTSIAFRTERDPRSAITQRIAISAPSTDGSAKQQSVIGLSGRGVYSHP